MQCQEFEDALNDLLDHRLGVDTDPHLLAHSFLCAQCADLLTSYRELLVRIEARSTHVTGSSPPEISTVELPVVEKIMPTGKDSRSSRYFFAAFAASVLLFCTVWIFHNTSQNESTLAVVEELPEAEGSPTSAVPKAGKNANSAHPLQLDGVTYIAAAEELAARQLGWVEPVKSGLMPVRSSMAATLNAIWPVRVDSADSSGSS